MRVHGLLCAVVRAALLCAVLLLVGACPRSELRCDPAQAVKTCGADEDCGEGVRCTGGVCVACPEDMVCSLDGLCQDQGDDPCGGAHARICFGRCVTPADEAALCTYCPQGCPAGHTCCPELTDLANGTREVKIGEGQCADTSRDEANCGACGVICGGEESAAPSYCIDGSCQPNCVDDSDCPAEHACCAGDCVFLASALEHCGRCGHACLKDGVCCAGRCVSGLQEAACGLGCAVCAGEERCTGHYAQLGCKPPCHALAADPECGLLSGSGTCLPVDDSCAGRCFGAGSAWRGECCGRCEVQVWDPTREEWVVGTETRSCSVGLACVADEDGEGQVCRALCRNQGDCDWGECRLGLGGCAQLGYCTE